MQSSADYLAKRAEWEAIVEAFTGASGKGWLRASCPACIAASGHDKKKSLGFNTATSGYNCNKCGMHGRLPPAYRAKLNDLIDLQDAPLFGTQVETIGVDPAPGFVPLFEEPYLSLPSLADLRRYVTAPKTERINGAPCRNIPEQRAREMHMGTGSYSCTGRIVTPILDWRGLTNRWLGWHGRDATGTNQIPHLYSPGLNRHITLWNGAALAADTDEPLFVCEGILDAQAVWPHGVACLGKPIPSHLSLLLTTQRPIVVCLDGDAWEEGWAFSVRLAMYHKRAAHIRLPPKTDPDEVPRDFLFEEARKALRF